MALIIEVLNPRTGAVTSRRRVAAMPFTIGRALDNALVLEDPHVDARHAVLAADEASGDLILEDLGSVNGLQTRLHGRAVRLRVRSGAEVRLGRTTLRFRDESDPIPPAIPLHGTAAGPQAFSGAALPRILFCIGVFALLGWTSWLGTTARSGASEALGLTLALAGGTALWAGAWALVSRSITHQGRFLTHLTIASFLTLLTMMLGTADEWVDFLWPDGRGWDVTNALLSLGLLAASIALHLAVATYLSPARRWRAGVTVSVVFVVLFGLFALSDDDSFTDVPTYSSRIETLRPSLVPKLDPAALQQVHADLRADVDRLIAEPD